MELVEYVEQIEKYEEQTFLSDVHEAFSVCINIFTYY